MLSARCQIRSSLLSEEQDFMNVRFHGTAPGYTGGITSVESNNSADINALIDELGTRFGKAFRDVLLRNDTFFFLVNGKGIMQTGGFGTKLGEGDLVEIVPFFDAG